MDEYYETLGRIGACILASDDPIRGSRSFSNSGQLYKGYRVIRNNTAINLVAPSESEYINVETIIQLSVRFRNAIGEDGIKQLHAEYQNDLGQNVDEEEVVDIHLRRNLAEIDTEETQAATTEIERSVTDPDVRLNWITYDDTQLLNGFILRTRLFPDTVSVETYDAAVNRISHYAPRVDEAFTDRFGGFIEEIRDADENLPTGGADEGESEPESTGRGFA
ncbi:MAG: hypothetical protein ABEJ73_01175 [Haloplanus sp.]